MSCVARVTIALPTLLARFTAGEREVAVEAGSLADALRRLVDAHPPLAVHLFNESGGLREHVLCFHNETNTRWLDSLEVELAPGDRIAILQAVSGG